MDSYGQNFDSSDKVDNFGNMDFNNNNLSMFSEGSFDLDPIDMNYTDFMFNGTGDNTGSPNTFRGVQDQVPVNNDSLSSLNPFGLGAAENRVGNLYSDPSAMQDFATGLDFAPMGQELVDPTLMASSNMDTNTNFQFNLQDPMQAFNPGNANQSQNDFPDMSGYFGSPNMQTNSPDMNRFVNPAWLHYGSQNPSSPVAGNSETHTPQNANTGGLLLPQVEPSEPGIQNYPSPEGLGDNSFSMAQGQATGSSLQANNDNVYSGNVSTSGATSAAARHSPSPSPESSIDAAPAPVSAPESTVPIRKCRKRKATPEPSPEPSPEPEAAGEGQARPQKRLKLKQFSCELCRKKKVKCNGEIGKTCSNCIKHRKTCVIDGKDGRTKNTTFGQLLDKLEKNHYLIKEIIYLGDRAIEDEQSFALFKAGWKNSPNVSNLFHVFAATPDEHRVEWETKFKQDAATTCTTAFNEILNYVHSMSEGKPKVKEVRPLMDRLKRTSRSLLFNGYQSLESLSKKDHVIDRTEWNDLYQWWDQASLVEMDHDNEYLQGLYKGYLQERGKLNPVYLKGLCGKWQRTEQCRINANITPSHSVVAANYMQPPQAPQPMVSSPAQEPQIIPEAHTDTIAVNTEAQAPVSFPNVPASVEAQLCEVLGAAGYGQPEQLAIDPALQQSAIEGEQAPIVANYNDDMMDINDAGAIPPDHEPLEPLFPDLEGSSPSSSKDSVHQLFLDAFAELDQERALLAEAEEDNWAGEPSAGSVDTMELDEAEADNWAEDLFGGPVDEMELDEEEGSGADESETSEADESEISEEE
ncbi:hypothetical protein PG989_012984 [Apiospora arundinis]